MKRLAKALAILVAALFLSRTGLSGGQDERVIRVGIIGLDTSHVVEFTRMLNDPAAPEHVAGARVVAAFRGGSPDVEASANRVEGFTAQLRDKFHIEIVADIPGLCSRVDAILLESVDGRTHLQQVKPVIAAKKPVFIDKPLAASLEDALEIARLAERAGVPWFSASSLRFHPAIQALKNDPKIGAILGCEAYGPAPTEPHHPDLFWYGIHGVEILYTLMGRGCQSLTRINTPGANVVVGKWADGRIGTFRGLREGKTGYGARVFGHDGIRNSDPVEGSSYRQLVEEIVKFFRTGVSPVPNGETLEIIAFMQAAEQSKARNGEAIDPRSLLR